MKKRNALVILFILVLAFVAGYIIADKILYPLATEEELEYYEQVAKEIDDKKQKYDIVVSFPDDVDINAGDIIRVSKKGVGFLPGAGYVEGKENNTGIFEVKRVFSEKARTRQNIKIGLQYSGVIVILLILVKLRRKLKKR